MGGAFPLTHLLWHNPYPYGRLRSIGESDRRWFVWLADRGAICHRYVWEENTVSQSKGIKVPHRRIRGVELKAMARTTRLELATSAVTVSDS